MIEEEYYLRPGLEQLAEHYKEVITLLGEDANREASTEDTYARR